jgi:GTPase SAR1 family protein
LAEPTILFYNVSSNFNSVGATPPLVYSNADAVLLCFDVDNRVSFDNVHGKWLAEIQKAVSGIPTTLVGLKGDQSMSSSNTGNIKATITSREAQKLARKLGFQTYFDYTLPGDKSQRLLQLTEQVSETRNPRGTSR